MFSSLAIPVTSLAHDPVKTTMGNKSVETRGSKIQFSSILGTVISPLPPPPQQR